MTQMGKLRPRVTRGRGVGTERKSRSWIPTPWPVSKGSLEEMGVPSQPHPRALGSEYLALASGREPGQSQASVFHQCFCLEHTRGADI